ncbi:MAG: M48 family metallopeptidase [Litoreibacter sp.]
MFKLIPLVLAVVYALISYKFSVWNFHKQLDAKSTPLKDPKIDALTNRMANALDLPKIKVNIYEVDPVNGLASADGRIFITRGFFNKYKAGDVTATEIASVIAHELGHVALGHSRRRMIDFSGQNAIRVIMTSLIGRFIPFIGPWIANLIASTLAARLSQRDEYEADAYASALLTKSGIGTDAQKQLFSKLNKISGMGKRSTPAWLLSHPKTEDRIAAIEKNELKWQQ